MSRWLLSTFISIVMLIVSGCLFYYGFNMDFQHTLFFVLIINLFLAIFRAIFNHREMKK